MILAITLVAAFYVGFLLGRRSVRRKHKLLHVFDVPTARTTQTR